MKRSHILYCFNKAKRVLIPIVMKDKPRSNTLNGSVFLLTTTGTTSLRCLVDRAQDIGVYYVC